MHPQGYSIPKDVRVLLKSLKHANHDCDLSKTWKQETTGKIDGIRLEDGEITGL